MRRAGPKRIAKPAFVVFLGLILYLIATNGGASWLYVLVALVAAVVAVSAPLAWWNARGVEVARRAPVLATAGQPFECSLEIRNTGRLARHLLEVEDRFAGGTGRAVAVRVEPGRSEALKYTVTNPCRGIYAGGEVLVESGAPFGLFYGRSVLRPASRIVVHPRTFDVSALPPNLAVEAGRGDGSEASAPHRGHGGAFWGVREYRPGDPARLVAWKRSARGFLSGKLAVVEMARETQPPFVVALDLDPAAPPAAREMVVSVGASLLLYALREGREVRAHAGSQSSPFPDEATPDSVLTWCSGLQATAPGPPEAASVQVRPSTHNPTANGRPGRREPSGVSEAPAVALVSCHEFVGSGPWMSPEEERKFLDEAEANGRRVTRLGPGVEEPWRIG